MTITKIKKRDGRVLAFDKGKIRLATEKAMRAVDAGADLRNADLMTDHVIRHLEIKFKEGLPDVESVQDLVEKTLMEYGLFEVAKAYILYRAEHAKLRKEKPSQFVEGVGQLKLHFVNDEGTSKVLDRKKLQSWFDEAAGDLGGIDIESLVEHCEGNLYDGMRIEEVGVALVMAAKAFIERDPAYSKLAARLGLRNLYVEVFGETTNVNWGKAYRKGFVEGIKGGVKAGRLDKRMLEFNLEELGEYLVLERDELLEYLGFQVLYDRYFIREEGGERKLETPQIFWMRVAMGVALNEGAQKNEWAKKFYDLISTLKYVPSTPTLFHSGTTYPQLSSCYLNTAEDDLAHIFKVYGDNAQMSKYSGGIGTDWTNVRGTGALIKTTNVGSQGVVPFLKIANDVTVSINRSGKRRGATCVYLETWHYDFEDFLDLRRNTGDERRRTHDMNTANWIPDLFIKRVINDEQWTLFSPDETPELHHIYGKAFEKKYVEYEKKADKGEMRLFKRMKAKDLWRKMITMLFETGHPWVTFKDACNVRSPQDHVGVIHNSNLCTEITLNNSAEETAVCNLGSVNFVRHMKNGKLDKAAVKETVLLAMRILDNVIDLNFYPTMETKTANMRHRPVGLGIMGFQDALFMANINFGSDEAVEFADESMEMVAYYAILGSAQLAKEREAYESFKGSKWDRGIFPVDTLDLLEEERGMPIGVSRAGKLDWKPVREAVKKYGMRNSNTMATAPTATISNISGCFPCIEPIYENLYVKSNMSGEFTVVNTYLVEDLKKLGLWSETMFEEMKRGDGSIQEITSIPPMVREKYKTVFEVGARWLVKIAAYRGKWIDQSQSLNIFYNGTSGKELSDIYMMAWHLGLKTTYYLRSLAATGVEKSTVTLSQQTTSNLQLTTDLTGVGNGQVERMEMVIVKEEVVENGQENVRETVVVEEEVRMPIAAIEMEEPQKLIEEMSVKACLINDPECEACQ